MAGIHHRTADIVDTKTSSDPLAVMASASLSLGLFLAWVSLGWNHDGTAFGVPTEPNTLFHLLLQGAIALTFAALSFAKPPLANRSNEFFAAVGTGAALVGVLAFWLGSGLRSNAVCAPAALVAGGAQALFMWAWLRRYRIGTSHTFVALAAASGICYLFHLLVLLFGNAPARACSAILPLLALTAFVVGPKPTANALQATNPSDHGQTGRSPLPWTVALLLCCFAGGVASFSAPTGSEQGLCLIAIVSFGLSLAAVFLGSARTVPLFIGLSLCVCVCVALALVAPSSEWLSGLTFAGFWMLEVYAFAWFSQRDRTPELSPGATRCLAAVYALSGIANIVGLAVPAQVTYATALVLTAAAFAMTSFDMGRSTIQEDAPAGSHPKQHDEPTTAHWHNDLETSASSLARRFDLTEAEQGVFLYLARGYALKQIALELHISESTAKYHRRNIYQKCGVTSRQELINLVEDAVE